MISTVTSKGQITLPAAIRKTLDLKAGDKIDLVVDSEGQIHGKRLNNSLEGLANILPRSKKRLSLEQMDRAIQRRADSI